MIFLLFLCLSWCTLLYAQVSKEQAMYPFLQGKFQQLAECLHKQDDTLRVFHFWATWCVPCVEELPHLREIERTYSRQPIHFIYVSLDFKKDISKLGAFIQQNMEKHATVFWLYDEDADLWIRKIDPEWSGSIPVTLLLKNKKRVFLREPIQSPQELLRTIDANF